MGLCVQGVSAQGGLCLGEGLCPGGICSQGSLSGGSRSGGLCQADPLYGNERAVRIPLACILVSSGIGQYTDSKNTLSIPGTT